MSSFKKRLTRDDYRVGWISALPLEMAAAMAMLDASHVSLPQPRGDHNSYHLGQIGDHNIVIACLPTGVYGITSAAIVAKQMLLSFPSIEVGLMVGIGGGAPSESVDIRLGDIVVSTPTPRFSGVVQYDLGKTLANGVFHRTGTLNRPPDLLLTAVSNLQARHKLGNNNIGVQLEAISKHRDASSKVFAYPGASQDVLFDPTYVHQPDEPSCTTCDRSKAIIRPPRLSTVPCIHYGLIASANQVIKDAQTRDKLANEMGILCYEMEAAGLMDRFPCLVIRGICDYSDSHKDKQWQDYAAAAAAAYARELLEFAVPAPAAPQRESAAQTIRSKLPVSTSAFYGREAELGQLRQCFGSPNSARQAAVIWGMSGYGKTQLAVQYATAHKAKYTTTLWIDSSSKAIIEQSFEHFSVQLGSTSQGQPAVDMVLQWLEQETNQSWIMIFDGVGSLDENDQIDDFDLRSFFPFCNHGHLLLVTTASDLHRQLAFPGVQVQRVDDQTGARILLRCARRQTPDPDSEIEKTAMMISRKLGGMPLALEQAGTFLSYGLVSISEYNKQFQLRYFDQTLKTPTKKYIGSYEKGRTVWTTFDLLYCALKDRSPDAIKILHLAAFLGRGRIPFSTLYGKHKDEGSGTGLGISHSSLDIPSDTLPRLISCFIELRSDIHRFAPALEELEASGFVSFARSAAETVIESFVLHDLALAFVKSNLSPQESLDLLAASLFLNGQELYDGNGIPDDALLRKHMGRLAGVLELFLSRIPNNMLQPPDGEYFVLCASVAPLYAMICRYTGRLETAADLWAMAFQYRFISDGGQPSKYKAHVQEIMEAAGIDSRIGNLASAIDRYSLAVTWSEYQHNSEMAAQAAGLLREAREKFGRRERDAERAIVAQSAPKLVSQHADQDGEMNQKEWELKMSYEDALDLFGDRDWETVHHAGQLAAYYQLRNRRVDEAPYRHTVWTYYRERYGHAAAGTRVSLRALCDCYYETGVLGSRIAEDLHLARGWAVALESSLLSDLLWSNKASDALRSLSRGDYSMIGILLDKGELDTALCWASLQPPSIRKGVLEHLGVGRSDGLGPLLLDVALRPWSGIALEILLDLGVHKNHCNKSGISALHLAAKAGNTSGVQVLISRNVAVSQSDSTGQTALHLAAKEDHRPIAEALIAHGADVSQRTKSGRTALHLATMARSDHMVNLLLDSGADVSQADSQGRTALHLAAQETCTGVARVLLRRGARVLQTDVTGKTALQYAGRVSGSMSDREKELFTLLTRHAEKQGDNWVDANPQLVDGPEQSVRTASRRYIKGMFAKIRRK